eukprot:CAMPEP_0176248614 /NCGR_PEP_ID=MMETSP0121_2-20121125/33556_1 /TAXON_ID=160619 /ORGANISM="Kryptoperidinium foliaceum, Strain CCMP 1326" /LENGTH=257 /DNA_ID=CAMNT_0017588295 /DNA_START=34 /DNA_END=808 /DNA_ORIENTATION=+
METKFARKAPALAAPPPGPRGAIVRLPSQGGCRTQRDAMVMAEGPPVVAATMPRTRASVASAMGRGLTKRSRSPIALALALALALPLLGVAVRGLGAEGHRQAAAEALEAGDVPGDAPALARLVVLGAPPLGRRLLLALLAEPPVRVPLLADVDLLVGLVLDFLQQVPALAPASHVEVAAEVVPPLVPALPAAILPALGDPGVPVHADVPVVEVRRVQQVHRLRGLLVGVELHEAEAAWRLLEPVEAHHDPPDVPAL